MSEKLVIAKDVVKIYKSGTREVRAVDGLSFDVEEGELAVVLGPSGAGKTTILNLMGGMDSVTEGDLIVDGNNLRGLTARALTEYRRTDVGFVFQFYNLMPNLTAIEIAENSRLEEIGEGAFKECLKLKEVSLPASVKKICAEAFYGCSALVKAVVPSAADIDGTAFEGVSKKFELSTF